MRQLRSVVALQLFCSIAEGAKTAGFNWVAEGFEGPLPYDAPESIASIARARAVGINSFSLSFPWYIASVNSTGPIYPVVGPTPSGAPFNNASSPSDASVVTAIRAVRALGASVVLRPIIDPHWSPTQRGSSTWRGEIGTHFTAAQWTAFFASYSEYILKWARVAAAEGVDSLCVGAELAATESQVVHWRALLASVRAVFSGVVYYSATSGLELSWWDASDLIAIDMYPSLSTATADPDAVTVDALVAAWGPVLASYQRLSERFGNKPVLTQETGICSVHAQGLFSHPAFFECYGLPIDDAVQAKYYDAVFRGPYAQPWVAGITFWKWGAQGGPSDPTFFPDNKSTMEVIAQHLNPPRRAFAE